jgi:gamma-glutamyltranspeptidase
MAPIIVVQDGKLRFVAGSNGGPRIITTTLLALLNHLEFGMDVSEAVAAPRFHHQWLPDELLLEAGNPADVVAALAARGHVVKVVDDLGGGVEAIATVFALYHGVLPPTINYETPDPECDLDYVPNEARDAKVRVALSNSFAFGGNSSVVVLAKYA